jgi:predicted NACHT family NTPase
MLRLDVVFLFIKKQTTLVYKSEEIFKTLDNFIPWKIGCIPHKIEERKRSKPDNKLILAGPGTGKTKTLE